MEAEGVFVAVGLILLVLPLWLCLTLVRGGRRDGALAVIGAAAVPCFIFWMAALGARGWDALGWLIFAMAASLALAGAVIGAGVGLLMRRAERR